MSYDSLARPLTIVANGDTTAFTYDYNGAFQPHWTVARTPTVRDSVNVDVLGRPTTTVSALGGITVTQTSTYDEQGARNKLKLVSSGLSFTDSLQFSVD